MTVVNKDFSRLKYLGVAAATIVFVGTACSPKKKSEPEVTPAKDIKVIDPRSLVATTAASNERKSLGNVWIEAQTDVSTKQTTVFLKAAFHKPLSKNVFLDAAPVSEAQVVEVKHEDHDHEEDHDENGHEDHADEKKEPKPETGPHAEGEHGHDHGKEKGNTSPKRNSPSKKTSEEDHAH